VTAWQDDLARVLEIACFIEDRTRADQTSMLRVARKLDAARNAISIENPRTAHLPNTFDMAVALDVVEDFPCTYSDDHGKGCACREPGRKDSRPGFYPTPVGGWSRLVELVEGTRVEGE
jgi:hypothetical protein